MKLVSGKVIQQSSEFAVEVYIKGDFFVVSFMGKIIARFECSLIFELLVADFPRQSKSGDPGIERRRYQLDAARDAATLFIQQQNNQEGGMK